MRNWNTSSIKDVLLCFEFGHFPNMLRKYSMVVFSIRLMCILLLSADRHRTSSSTSYSQSPLDPAISEAVFLRLKLSLNSTKYVVGYLEKKQALLVIRVCFRLITIPQTHFFTPCVCGLNCTKSNCKSSGRMTVTFYCWTSQEGSLAIHGNSHCVAISSVVTNAWCVCGVLIQVMTRGDKWRIERDVQKQLQLRLKMTLRFFQLLVLKRGDISMLLLQIMP